MRLGKQNLIVLHRDMKPLENKWIERLWYYAQTIKIEVKNVDKTNYNSNKQFSLPSSEIEFKFFGHY